MIVTQNGDGVNMKFNLPRNSSRVHHREKCEAIMHREIEVIIEENRIEKLHITDDYVQAERLRDAGQTVLIYLHKGNRQQDFSSFRYAVEDPETVDGVFAERVVRRHLNLPWTILETNRCIVRETVESDAEAIVTMYQDREVAKYMPPLPTNLEDVRDMITAYHKEIYELYEFGIWTIIEKSTGQIIGRAGLEMKEEGPELGYMIDAPWRNRGYATEVCKAILNYAREELGIKEMLAFVQLHNEASLTVCWKLGFTSKEMVERDRKVYSKMNRTL